MDNFVFRLVNESADCGLHGGELTSVLPVEVARVMLLVDFRLRKAILNQLALCRKKNIR